MGMGEAAGLKLALPDRTVVLLIGDGSFYYNPTLAGLGVCQEYNLPILILLFNNGIYSAMRGMHLKYYPDGWAVRKNTYFGIDMAPVADFSKVAEAFDAYGERLDDPNEIEPALKRALGQIAKGRSALIDVVLDPYDTGGKQLDTF
jgi:acetolactate synthase-1/2/3 large subunit